MPGIARQFRGIEDLVESVERKDTINFIGTDISPVLRVDPPSIDLLAPVLEDVTVTGILTDVNMSTVPAGSYREVLQATMNHDDPVALNFVDSRIVRDVDGLFIAVRTTVGTIANPSTVSIAGVEHLFIPPGWHLRVVFLGLAAGRIARVKTLHIDRPLGLGSLR